MKPFVVNRRGRLVFPSNFLGELDFSVLENLEQLTAVIERDFEAKAPTGSEILARIDAGAYPGRYELLRDIGQNLYWVNRYALTMAEKRPTRWRDIPRHRADVFLPILTPWQDRARKVAAVERAYRQLRPTWNADVEDKVFGLLFALFRHRSHHATEVSPIKATVAEFLAQAEGMTLVLPDHDPDYPAFSLDEIVDADEPVPELEALTRWAMVLHNHYPFDRSRVELRPPSAIGDDDFVVAFHPRNPEVAAFVDRIRAAASAPDAPVAATRSARGTAKVAARQPVRPYPPVRVRDHFDIQPKLEALAVARGEHVCTNDDVIRNTSFSWSPMSAAEIAAKTGIRERRYTSRRLEELALDAARAALTHAGREPEEIGAVLVSTCTSTRLIPSVAAWISGELGMMQTHASVDLVAACAGLPYGLAEATRLLQEVDRPVLLVCAEKFSDKIGSVRTSRMIFGDGAAALVVAPAAVGQDGDIDLLQTYAGGPWSEVNSIIWPNPEFDNDITVYGPEVKALVQRYLAQMIAEIEEQPDPRHADRSMLSGIDLIVPHQANKTMIVDVARAAGLAPEQLYFNIETMGNVSAASIPIAIHDAVRDRVLTTATRVFAPGFGAGAVGGYVVARIDPSIVVLEVTTAPADMSMGTGTASFAGGATIEDVNAAFGG
ncbi:MAG TPA: 3-oxoacyl-[acyl-carrier-protein] synthase III C-terminal domain-containing protein [Pseudonocardia sp.]|nr:3-oxoacyl-[acyl-carrier-protein] synthase III C-terminal domain-containing protein [Pseudonocardia sp.]